MTCPAGASAGDAPPTTVDYTIDPGGLLQALSDSWDGFARRNGAPDLTREAVAGHPVWDYVAGADTRRVYELLFARVHRLGGPVTVPFRCDSPDRFRFMELEIAPTPEGGVRCQARLLRERARPSLSLLDLGLPRSDYTFPMCSLCKRVFAFGRWCEPEEAVARLGLLETEAPPSLEHGVCGACQRRLEIAERADGAPT